MRRDALQLCAALVLFVCCNGTRLQADVSAAFLTEQYTDKASNRWNNNRRNKKRRGVKGIKTSAQDDVAPNWYYKSNYVCTNSDDATKSTCGQTSEIHCDGGFSSLWCTNMVTCAAVASTVSPDSPEIPFAFMCPSMMLGTSEMVAAAKADGYVGAYAVVTLDKLSAGQCIEITNTDTVHYPKAPKITAQIFNSVASDIDIYMAGGGFGVFNGCHAATPNSFQGKQPLTSFYKTYADGSNTDLLSYLQSQGQVISDQELNDYMYWQGGLRGGSTFATCVSNGSTAAECSDNQSSGLLLTNKSACSLAFKGFSDYVTQKAIESCEYSFDHDLHWNRDVTYTIVTCPAGLTQITGLRPTGTSVTSTTPVVAKTTTMEDCCQPSYARAPNTGSGSWETGYDAFYSCNVLGAIQTEASQVYTTTSDVCA